MVGMASSGRIMSNAFAVRLIRLRTEHKMTPRDLSECARTSYTQIYAYESGAQIPRADVLCKLARALGVTMDYLWSGNDV